MGISGLLPLLKSIHRPCQLKKFKGQTLGVDAYGWLHRGIIAGTLELALNQPTRKHIDYVLHRVRMLIHFGVKPYLVFDGDHLPSKAGTEAVRRERRQQAMKEGLELLNIGQKAQAYKALQRAIDVTPQMTFDLIQELKKLDVAYIVAPYEADAQLAYLEKKGIINGVLSEDSDLLVFGVQRLLTKLDQYGNCVEVNRNEFSACRDISLIGWTDADFRRMAILSGCDYLENLPNMGLKTAYRLVRRHKTLDKILRVIQFDGTFVPEDYAAKFEQAERSFVHHRVFCPEAKGLVLLTDLIGDLKEDEMPYLGANVDAETAVLVAFGELDPMTKSRISGSQQHVRTVGKHPFSTSTNDENRRHTFGSTAELKDNKKINSFFKKRMPLAELDPNSLTPSPSQQRLLQRHSNASWVASPSPSPTVSTIHTTSQSRIRREDTDRFLAQAARTSDFNPSKRQRLCSDLEATTSENDIASPFFSNTSASAKKSAKVKKARGSNFGIFSDDSVEDILVRMPEPMPHEVWCDGTEMNPSMPGSDVINEHGRSEVASKEEIPVTEEATSGVEDNIDIVPASSPITGFEASIPSTTQATSSVSIGPEDDSFADLLEYHVQTQNAWLVEKYSHQPETGQPSKTKGSVQIQQTVKTCKAKGPAAKIQGDETALKDSAKEISKFPRIPLQQLNRSVLRESRSVPSLGRTEGIDSQGQIQVVKSPQRFGMSRTSTTVPQNGSEDLIVPSSEDEASHLSEDDDLPSARPILDLDRFAFQANKTLR